MGDRGNVVTWNYSDLINPVTRAISNFATSFGLNYASASVAATNGKNSRKISVVIEQFYEKYILHPVVAYVRPLCAVWQAHEFPNPWSHMIIDSRSHLSNTVLFTVLRTWPSLAPVPKVSPKNGGMILRHKQLDVRERRQQHLSQLVLRLFWLTTHCNLSTRMGRWAMKICMRKLFIRMSKATVERIIYIIHPLEL